MRVLVVDDDEFVRETIGILLDGTGLVAVPARDGCEAVAEFEKKPFAVALVDMLMPNRDGLETIVEIRRRWPATRIIAMSGGSRRIGRLAALDWAMGLGADVAVVKPFDPLMFASFIEDQVKLTPLFVPSAQSPVADRL